MAVCFLLWCSVSADDARVVLRWEATALSVHGTRAHANSMLGNLAQRGKLRIKNWHAAAMIHLSFARRDATTKTKTGRRHSRLKGRASPLKVLPMANRDWTLLHRLCLLQGVDTSCGYRVGLVHAHLSAGNQSGPVERAATAQDSSDRPLSSTVRRSIAAPVAEGPSERWRGGVGDLSPMACGRCYVHSGLCVSVKTQVGPEWPLLTLCRGVECLQQRSADQAPCSIMAANSVR